MDFRKHSAHGNAALKRTALCLSLFMVAACSPVLQGAPKRPFEARQELATIRAAYGAEAVARYRTASTERRAEIRNSIVLGRMYAIDIAYHDYEGALTRELQQVPFASAVTSIALSSTGAAVADIATKTALAAIDTGLKGAGNAFDDHILTGRSIDVLQKTMRASRNAIRARIVEGLSLGDLQYPLELALSDVETYYNAGTISAGLNEMSATSTLRLAESQVSLVASNSINRYGADDATARLRQYWRNGGADAAAEIRRWLDVRGMSASITAFLNDEKYAQGRVELQRYLDLQE